MKMGYIAEYIGDISPNNGDKMPNYCDISPIKGRIIAD
jgi:hypothetical protein